MIDAKEYLESFRTEEARIQLKVKQLQVLEDRLHTTTVPIDTERVSHTKTTDAMAETIAIVIDLQEEINMQKCQLAEAKRDAFRLLDQISPDSASILISRYFMGMTIKQIGKTLYSSRTQTYRRLQGALSEFQEILSKTIS